MLPYLKPKSEKGELWQLNSTGGSGFYSWMIEDTFIAEISGSGLVRQKEIGKTYIKCIDSLNKRNFATLDLEVISISSLGWLEDHMEIKNKEEGIISIIAYDRFGRKFTNCTSLDV